MDILSEVYKYIDFSITRIAGSYALQQFTKDFSWKPNDVDIVVFDLDIDEFKKYVEEFCKETLYSIIVFKSFDKNDRKILATYKVKNNNVLIEFILIDSDKTIEEEINLLCDIPSCVSYIVINNIKFFTIPERAIESILTRKVNKKDIHSLERLIKYQQRGYEFY